MDDEEHIPDSQLPAFVGLGWPAAPDPFNGYSRTLTFRGGFRIAYEDQAASGLLDALRFLSGITLMGFAGWGLFVCSPLSLLGCLVAFVPTASLIYFGVTRPIRVAHSIEIHPDGLIIDDREFFSLAAIGENWPQLQMKGDNENRYVLCGVCGTRFIEYATANRIDKTDRTPERLAQDLEIAMEQLWGRHSENPPLDLSGGSNPPLLPF
jgi:hypothetical protein